jgi:hypothetical protein
MNWWIALSAGAAFLTWTGLVVWYAIRAKWWKTHIGQNTMAVSFVIALAMMRAFTVAAFDVQPVYALQPWQAVVGALIYTMLAFLGGQRIYFVEMSQRREDLKVPYIPSRDDRD